MMYSEFNVGEKTYKLRLTTQNVVILERGFGCSLMQLFNEDEVPKVDVMATILHAALQTYQHNITLKDAYNILDTWVDEGNDLNNFNFTIFEVFQISGLIPKNMELPKPGQPDGEEEETEKN